MNLYAYAGNNPISYDDPFGLECHPEDVTCKDYGPILGAGCPAISDGCNATPLIPKSGKEALVRGSLIVGATAIGFGVMELAAGATAVAAPAAASSTALSTTETGLLREFFGQGVKGVEKRLADFKLPKGLTPDALNKYAKIATDVVEKGIDKTGVQAGRLALIERALKELTK